ncbi:hypothetical protein WJX75_004748 [Coccomyxa subellipsoidea]|uniref:Uncharacterized protein n=1 Tax=Coccomyxa subellipsoidea TaxID=248742 RepID=A0ABR2YY44_9CHLO
MTVDEDIDTHEGKPRLATLLIHNFSLKGGLYRVPDQFNAYDPTSRPPRPLSKAGSIADLSRVQYYESVSGLVL